MKPRIDYFSYIQSDKWRAFRARIISKRKCCFICSRKDVLFNIHHRTYKRLGNERETDVVLLCQDCHMILHDLFTDASNKDLKGLFGYARRMKRRYEKSFNGNHDETIKRTIRKMKQNVRNRVLFREGKLKPPQFR